MRKNNTFCKKHQKQKIWQDGKFICLDCLADDRIKKMKNSIKRNVRKILKNKKPKKGGEK